MTEKQFKPPWQPMSTAPKDKQILAFDGKRRRIVEFNPVLSVYGMWVTVPGIYGFAPTAWMPLPDAPEEMP